jgi:hypothetical protein
MISGQQSAVSAELNNYFSIISLRGLSVDNAKNNLSANDFVAAVSNQR